jgi:hypothetical protein
MGDSPWGAGGPDLWTELDTTMGMRFEFMPQFIPFIKPGSLNIGFVLNNFDGSAEQIAHYGGKITLESILGESVLGIAYTHDFFHVRLAYRMDSLTDGDISEQFVYRMEERIIHKYLPGFQIIANGYWKGLNPRAVYAEGINPDDVDPREGTEFYNWAYIHYDPPILFSPLDMSYIAQFRLGYDSINNTRKKIYVKPGFYLTFLNNFFHIGAAFEYAGDVGELRVDANAPYLHWYIEPEIRLNLYANSYIALVYRYYNDYEFRNPDLSVGGAVNTKTHWLNLRVLFTF